MMVYDLKCGAGHVFEAWFASSEAYERQRGNKLIACPICQDGTIEKAVMAPAIPVKSNQRRAAGLPRAEQSSIAAGLPAEVRDKLAGAVARLAEAQAEAITRSRWVGDKFADEARAMHYGEREETAIHGTASANDAKAMLEEGLNVAPLLIPVAPPEQIN